MIVPALTWAQGGQHRFDACYQDCIDNSADQNSANAVSPKTPPVLTSQCVLACEYLHEPAATLKQELNNRSKMKVGVVSLKKYR
jgi:hypothetical protein